MVVKEFGTENTKTFMLLPGTSCTWEINFSQLVEPLSKQFRVLCVNYTGFDGGNSIFDTQEKETTRIEKYVLKQFSGHLDAVYGSSMGGSFASLLVQRKKIHIDHVFIGSSDLDQASPVIAKAATAFMGAFMKLLTKHPEKAMAKFSKAADAKGMSIEEEDLKSSGLDDDYLQHMMQGFLETVGKTDIRSVKNQFYSDLVTKLDAKISVPDTKIHIFYSEKMGEKYLKRYYKHYADPQIIPLAYGHEGWLGNPQMMIEIFDTCMGVND